MHYNSVVAAAQHYCGNKIFGRGSDDWLKFFDYAAAGLGQIPYDIMDDEKLLAKLPLLFRTVRGAALSREELEKMIDKLREE